MAVVDLTELTVAFEGGPTLPPAGCLLFYADVGPGSPAAGGKPTTYAWYGEPTENVAGAGARVLWMPPGEEPVEVDAPRLPGSKPIPASHRLGVHELTLHDGEEVAQRLYLDPGSAYALKDAFTTHRNQGVTGWSRSDWVLGGAFGINTFRGNDSAESVLLLNLNSIDFQDGGFIEFRIPLEALRQGDWSAAVAHGKSS